MRSSSIFAVTAALISSTHSLAVEKRDAAPGFIEFALLPNPKVLANLGKRSVKRSGEVTLPDTNYQTQLLYILELQLGTPPQTTFVQLDTGSSDLVVETPSSDICSTAPPNPCTNFGSCRY
jgi:hypothetical protein